MSVTYFESLTDAANWLMSQSNDGESDSVVMSAATVLRAMATEPNAERRIAAQAILNFLQNVANS